MSGCCILSRKNTHQNTIETCYERGGGNRHTSFYFSFTHIFLDCKYLYDYTHSVYFFSFTFSHHSKKRLYILFGIGIHFSIVFSELAHKMGKVEGNFHFRCGCSNQNIPNWGNVFSSNHVIFKTMKHRVGRRGASVAENFLWGQLHLLGFASVFCQKKNIEVC